MNFLQASAVFSLCLGSLVAVDESFWTTSSSVSTEKDREQHFICTSRCAAEKKFHAVVLANGDCSCEESDKNIADSTHIIRDPPHSKYVAFMPLTNGPHGFKSLGTENVVETIHGTAMSFSEYGPPGFPAEKRVLRLKPFKVGGMVNFLSYAIPQSLRNKVEASGMIITFWVRFAITTIGNFPIFQFGIQGSVASKLRFWLYYGSATASSTMNYIVSPADTQWHHIAIVLRQNPMIFDMRYDGVIKGSKSHGGLAAELSQELNLGYRLENNGDEYFADAAIYCFTIQELGTKTDAEINAAIDNTKTVCDQY